MNDSIKLARPSRIKSFYTLCKPGIIKGNTITLAGGFALASQGHFHWLILLKSFLGLACIIASACTFNNIIDKDRDALMLRTKNRPLVTNALTSKEAAFFGTLLLIFGTAILALGTNALTTLVALFGFFAYVVVYSFSKYKTVHATLLGSISGAIPPLVGYTAVANVLDLPAGVLFLILVFWQMPHFFAIAIYRLDEYKNANIPVLPARRSMQRTKVEILVYTILFGAVALLPAFLQFTGPIYLVTSSTLGIAWIVLAVGGFFAKNTTVWARKHFLLSLIVILGVCGALFTS